MASQSDTLKLKTMTVSLPARTVRAVERLAVSTVTSTTRVLRDLIKRSLQAEALRLGIKLPKDAEEALGS